MIFFRYHRIYAMKGTSYVDDFRYATDPLWQRAWTERMAPYVDKLPDNRNDLLELVAKDDSIVVYDNFFSARIIDAYKSCKVVDVPKRYDEQYFAYAFRKGSPYLAVFDYHLNVCVH
jgi:hypothetical protein